MSENRALAILAAVGITVMSVLFVGLHYLGAGNGAIVVAVLVCVSVTCWLVGVVPDHLPRRRR